jgi:2,3-dihydroxybenzoate decarboxylase
VAVCKKIALEGHFLAPGFDDYWKTSLTDVAPAVQSQLHDRLTDFGEQRLAAMPAPCPRRVNAGNGEPDSASGWRRGP